MHFNKLRPLDDSSHGVTLPHDDLLADGYLDENGDLRDEYQVQVQREAEGEWSLKVWEQPTPRAAD